MNTDQVIKFQDYDFSEDFVAISSEVDDDMACFHTGLIISYEDKIYYFHYTGKKVELKDVTNDTAKYKDLYLKRLDIIVDEDVVTFLGHCEKLDRKGIHPQYGFVFNDSYYDSSKEPFLVNAVHDITTCVGFCIKIIRGFIYSNPEYIKISDWNNGSLQNVPQWLWDHIHRYLQLYASQNGLSVSQLYGQNELKRILPVELLTSGFFQELPISKAQIDTLRPQVENHIQSFRVA